MRADCFFMFLHADCFCTMKLGLMLTRRNRGNPSYFCSTPLTPPQFANSSTQRVAKVDKDVDFSMPTTRTRRGGPFRLCRLGGTARGGGAGIKHGAWKKETLALLAGGGEGRVKKQRRRRPGPAAAAAAYFEAVLNIGPWARAGARRHRGAWLAQCSSSASTSSRHRRRSAALARAQGRRPRFSLAVGRSSNSIARPRRVLLLYIDCRHDDECGRVSGMFQTCSLHHT